MADGKKIDNLIMRVFLETTESIVGLNGLKSILNYGGLSEYIGNYPPDDDVRAIPLEHLKSLYTSLHEMFGDNGAHTLMLQVGRENVRRGLEKRPAIAKTMRVAGHVLPENMKMRLGLENLLKYMGSEDLTSDGLPHAEIREEDGCFYLIQRESVESDGISSKVPVCGVSRGIIEALMEWITGHAHKVEEVECRAMGHHEDVFRISKSKKEN